MKDNIRKLEEITRKELCNLVSCENCADDDEECRKKTKITVLAELLLTWHEAEVQRLKEGHKADKIRVLEKVKCSEVYIADLTSDELTGVEIGIGFYKNMIHKEIERIEKGV